MLIKQTEKHVEFAVALMQKVADGKTSAVTFWHLTEPCARGQRLFGRPPTDAKTRLLP